MKLNVILLSLLFIAGCAASPKKQSSVFESGRLTKLNKMKQARDRKEEDLNINKILVSARAVKKEQVLKQYPLPSPLTEESFFAQILQTYQARDLDRLEFYVHKFVKDYPRSVFADNAIYLNGQLKLLMGLPSEALREFEKVLSAYPTGNKRVASLFGKGVAYRKLNLKDYAQKIFAEVKKDFPGSPESYRVELEEKLLSAASE